MGCRGRFHILGLGIDSKERQLKKWTSSFKKINNVRAQAYVKMLEENNFQMDHSILNKKKGIITLFEIYLAATNNDTLFHDFSRKWLYKESPGYIRIERMTFREAISLIHGSGGIAVLAHPGHTVRDGAFALENTIREMKEAGLDAIEVFSTKHDKDQTGAIYNLAKKYKLAMSAGSDFHGYGKQKIGGFKTYGLKFDQENIIELIRKQNNRY